MLTPAVKLQTGFSHQTIDSKITNISKVFIRIIYHIDPPLMCELVDQSIAAAVNEATN